MMKPEERYAVIEECARVCDRLAREWVRADAGTSAYAAQDCADAIRALPAQSPAGVPPEPRHVEDALRRACDEPTLVDALSFVALWECDRVIPQAHEFLSGRKPRDADGRGWDTCFGHLFARVIAAWNERAAGVPTTEPVAPIARDAVRLRWLHSQASCSPDAEGYEWGVYRVRWEDGRPASVLATLSDSSDLDAVIADRAFALCTCDTKTPELSCHAADCAFRVWALAPQAPAEPVARSRLYELIFAWATAGTARCGDEDGRERHTNARRAMDDAIATLYAAPQAPVEPVAQPDENEQLERMRERQRQRFEMGHEQTPTPLYDSPVEAGWVAMKDRKPKANQVVCVYWPPNLKDGSHVVDVVEWGVHDCARLLLTGYNHCHSQFATYWIPLPTP
jgi:hypothetical protein